MTSDLTIISVNKKTGNPQRRSLTMRQISRKIIKIHPHLDSLFFIKNIYQFPIYKITSAQFTINNMPRDRFRQWWVVDGFD